MPQCESQQYFAELESLKAILRSLNSEAEPVPIKQGGVPLEKVLNTGKFNFERAQQVPGWRKELRGKHTPETEEYGIGSFAYNARRPFHPQKFHDLLNVGWFGKGYYVQKAFLACHPPTLYRPMEPGRRHCPSRAGRRVLENDPGSELA